MPSSSYTFTRLPTKDTYASSGLIPQIGTIVVNEDIIYNIALEGGIIIQLNYGDGLSTAENTNIYVNNVFRGTLDQTPCVTCTIGDIITFETTSTYTSNWYLRVTDDNDVFITSSTDIEPTKTVQYTVTSETTVYINNYAYSECCVPYYSQILYPNDLTKSAEDVKVGDLIMGYNESNNTYEEVNVLGVIRRERNEIVKIVFEDDTILEVTPDHPILTDYGWCAYKPETATAYESMGLIHQLTPQQKVLQLNGEYKQIKEIQLNILEQPIDVYTFNTTEGVDTFIVENCVTHNAGCK